MINAVLGFLSMNYFAYGSNMSIRRLQQRVPGARALGPARLQGHQLRWHKVGRDGSGKCDAFFTGRMADAIHGVLYHVDPAGKSVLDRVEGLGAGYDEKRVALLHGERALEAVTYVATHIDGRLDPFDWYHHHVLVGAREAGLPSFYLSEIERVAAIADPDRDRYAREFAIHG
jgi:gamma-glutamylcyclotransferase (GGCT)/AIG2-like uncharacterized protein YtfP